MCEFAPGSPWNTMVLRFFACLVMACCYQRLRWTSPSRRRWGSCAAPCEHGARLLQLLGRVDAERHRRDQRDVDAHAGLERAQLLELLAPLQRRGREPHEPLERVAAVGVEPDVMVERPVAVRRGGAG